MGTTDEPGTGCPSLKFGTNQAGRLTGAERIAALLDERDGLRDGLSLDHARDIIWIYNDPALHYALVHAREWNQDHYLDWLTDNLHHHLLG
jgi:hypothetical protein